MISREIKLYSTILGLLLVGAFFSWKAERSPKRASRAELVAMLDTSADELKAISLKQKDGETTRVRFDGKGDEKTAWVEVTKPAPTPKPAASPEANPAASPAATPEATPAPAATPTKHEFPGGAAAMRLLEQYAPLQAVRALGKIDDEQRAEFELDAPAIELTVETGRRTHALKVGGTAFGSGDYYVEDADGRTWLVKAGTLRPLLNGEGLMERSLHDLEDEDVTTLLVKSGDREAKYVHQNRLDRRARYWAKEATPETRETQVATWLGKARRLPVLRYPDTQPDSPDVKLALVYKDESGKELGRFEVAPRDGEPPLIRTDKTRIWAESDKVRVDELLGELDAILR